MPQSALPAANLSKRAWKPSGDEGSLGMTSLGGASGRSEKRAVGRLEPQNALRFRCWVIKTALGREIRDQVRALLSGSAGQRLIFEG
jgi:hypothetical protein